MKGVTKSIALILAFLQLGVAEYATYQLFSYIGLLTVAGAGAFIWLFTAWMVGMDN